MIWEVAREIDSRVPTCINKPGARQFAARVPDIDDSRRTSFLRAFRTCPRCLMQFPLSRVSSSLSPHVPSRPARPPPPTFFARKSLGQSARSNKLQLLESTFELRLGRARYDNQRNPVSRIATVMNSSDVAGSARKEDHRRASSPEMRPRVFCDAIESVDFTRPR